MWTLEIIFLRKYPAAPSLFPYFGSLVLKETWKICKLFDFQIGPSVRYNQHDALFFNFPQGGSFPIKWHQDWTFWPHTNKDLVMGFLSIDDSSRENGKKINTASITSTGGGRASAHIILYKSPGELWSWLPSTHLLISLSATFKFFQWQKIARRNPNICYIIPVRNLCSHIYTTLNFAKNIRRDKLIFEVLVWVIATTVN